MQFFYYYIYVLDKTRIPVIVSFGEKFALSVLFCFQLLNDYNQLGATRLVGYLLSQIKRAPVE